LHIKLQWQLEWVGSFIVRKHTAISSTIFDQHFCVAGIALTLEQVQRHLTVTLFFMTTN
jgi:hypothetical protein